MYSCFSTAISLSYHSLDCLWMASQEPDTLRPIHLKSCRCCRPGCLRMRSNACWSHGVAEEISQRKGRPGRCFLLWQQRAGTASLPSGSSLPGQAQMYVEYWLSSICRNCPTCLVWTTISSEANDWSGGYVPCNSSTLAMFIEACTNMSDVMRHAMPYVTLCICSDSSGVIAAVPPDVLWQPCCLPASVSYAGSTPHDDIAAGGCLGIIIGLSP